MDKSISFPANPFLDADEFVKIWRQKRANRVGITICRAGVYLSLGAAIAGALFSNVLFWSVHLLIFFGCVLSLYFSHKSTTSGKPRFVWEPAYFSYWLSSFGTCYATGGITSPFLALVLLGLYVTGVIVQTRFRPMFVLLFISANILFWMIFEFFHPVSHLSSQQPPVFTAAILFAGLGVLVTCVVEMLKTEKILASEVLERYSELTVANQKLAKEEVANVAKTTFLAHVSHELRTPLGAILGYTDLLKDPQNSAADREKFVDTIRRNGRQLSQLVDDLLDLSKVEVGKIEIENIEFSLKQLLADVLDLLAISAQKKNLKLKVHYENQIPEYILSDPLRIKQILMNVIGNALKFTEQGSVTLNINCNSSENDLGHFTISIVDTGPGLTEEQQSKLFQPFSQTEASMARKYGGTGLGLSLSLKLAELLGGELKLAESQLGKGSVFVFNFPAKFASSLKAVEPKAVKENLAVSIPQTKKTPDPIFKGQRILVVDDIVDNQNLIRAYLHSTGAEIDTANNGQEGFEKAISGQYAVVLMDIQMPVMDGLQATRKLRDESFNGPIIAITAHAMKEDRESCLSAGCDEYLTKPVHRSSLIQQIQMQLNKKVVKKDQPEAPQVVF